MLPIPSPTEVVLPDVVGVETGWEEVLPPLLSIDRLPEDDEGGDMTFVEDPGLKFGARDSLKEGLLCDVMTYPVSPFSGLRIARPTACACVDTGAATLPASGVIVLVLVTVLDLERCGPTFDELEDSLRWWGGTNDIARARAEEFRLMPTLSNPSCDSAVEHSEEEDGDEGDNAREA